MPPPVQVTINQKSYAIPILTSDMDNVVQQMVQQKDAIDRNRQRMNDAKVEYDNSCNTLLLLYIQQTGSYPS
jgi:gamma-glutamyl phosphate reductase